MEREKTVYVSGECASMVTAATSDVFQSPQLTFPRRQVFTYLQSTFSGTCSQSQTTCSTRYRVLIPILPGRCYQLRRDTSVYTIQSSGFEPSTSTTTTQPLLPEHAVARTNADTLHGTDSPHGSLYCVASAELQLEQA